VSNITVAPRSWEKGGGGGGEGSSCTAANAHHCWSCMQGTHASCVVWVKKSHSVCQCWQAAVAAAAALALAPLMHSICTGCTCSQCLWSSRGCPLCLGGHNLLTHVRCTFCMSEKHAGSRPAGGSHCCTMCACMHFLLLQLLLMKATAGYG